MKTWAYHSAKSLLLGYMSYFKCRFPRPTSRDYESVVMEAQEIHISENKLRDTNIGDMGAKFKNHYSPFLRVILPTYCATKEEKQQQEAIFRLLDIIIPKIVFLLF